MVCYGAPVLSPTRLAKMRGPLLGIYGKLDQGIPPEQVKKFGSLAQAARRNARMIEYSGVGHAFLNDTNKDYDEMTAHRAWTDIDAFLGKIWRPRRGDGGRPPAWLLIFPSPLGSSFQRPGTICTLTVHSPRGRERVPHPGSALAACSTDLVELAGASWVNMLRSNLFQNKFDQITSNSAPRVAIAPAARR